MAAAISDFSLVLHKPDPSKYPSNVSLSTRSVIKRFLRKIDSNLNSMPTYYMGIESHDCIRMLQVWRVFGHLLDPAGNRVEPKKVFCKLCFDKKSMLSGYSEATGTDALSNHLSRNHQGEFYN